MYQDIVQLLQPTIVVLRVCGVCPSAIRKCHIPTINKLFATLQGVVVLYMAVQFINIMYQILNDITCFFAIITYVLFTSSLLVMLFSAFLTSKDLIKVFKIMESIQRSLFCLNIKQPHTPSATVQTCWVVFLFLPAAIVLLLMAYDGYEVEVMFFKLILTLIRTGTVCKMRVLLSLLNHKLELLNWHLKDLNHFWPSFLPRPPSHDRGFKELSQEAEWRSTKFVHRGLDNGTLTAQKVRGFNKAHLKLHYAYRTLNAIFSLPLFAMYVANGLQISYHIFIVGTDAVKKSNLVIGIYIFEKVVAVLLTSYMSSIIEKNFRTTAHLVNGLLDDDSHPEEVVLELEKFSKILLHRKTTFSAAGFFDTNLKIVTRMASLFAPIILFLVQNNNRPRAGRHRHE